MVTWLGEFTPPALAPDNIIILNFGYCPAHTCIQCVITHNVNAISTRSFYSLRCFPDSVVNAGYWDCMWVASCCRLPCQIQSEIGSCWQLFSNSSDFDWQTDSSVYRSQGLCRGFVDRPEPEGPDISTDLHCEWLYLIVSNSVAWKKNKKKRPHPLLFAISRDNQRTPLIKDLMVARLGFTPIVNTKC